MCTLNADWPFHAFIFHSTKRPCTYCVHSRGCFITFMTTIGLMRRNSLANGVIHWYSFYLYAILSLLTSLFILNVDFYVLVCCRNLSSVLYSREHWSFCPDCGFARCPPWSDRPDLDRFQSLSLSLLMRVAHIVKWIRLPLPASRPLAGISMRPTTYIDLAAPVRAVQLP